MFLRLFTEGSLIHNFQFLALTYNDFGIFVNKRFALFLDLSTLKRVIYKQLLHETKNKLIGSSGCGGTSTSLMKIFKTEEMAFKVFPNPATEFLSIQFLSDSKETELQITDIMGKSLYGKNLGRTSKRDVYDIDINALPKGIHILTVSNELDKKITKIVVQ